MRWNGYTITMITKQFWCKVLTKGLKSQKVNVDCNLEDRPTFPDRVHTAMTPKYVFP